MKIEQFRKRDNPFPFKLGDVGDIDFYKNKEDVDNPRGFLVNSLFFPSSYEEYVGKGNPVYAKIDVEPINVEEFYPLLSSRLIDFLEGQGPGCTDLGIPLKATIGDVVYVYTLDGAAGDSLLTCHVDAWDKHEALRMIEDFHLDEWNEEDDEEWD